MDEILENFFASQELLSEFANQRAETLGSNFRQYDLKSSISVVAGLLTVPKLQGNTYRLEALAHLITANARGKKKPNGRQVARWFKQAGAAFSMIEDPAEDVFVSRVFMEGRNYRVLEGLAEANGHHLQHMLSAVERMPDRGVYSELKKTCKAALSLSDSICARSKLDAFSRGEEYALDALPSEEIPTVKTLAARTSFTRDDFVKMSVDHIALRKLFCSPSRARFSIGGFGENWLEKRPLLEFEREVIVALPTAIGTAIRQHVIETCLSTGSEAALWKSILLEHEKAISLNPALSALRLSATKTEPRSSVVSSVPIEFQPGLWFHLIVFTDDFTGFAETGLNTPRPNPDAEEVLQNSIDDVAAHTRKQPGFKLGLSLVVLCGFGRSQTLGFARPPYWLVEGISNYDLEVLGWREDFDVAELLKFLLAEGSAKEMGFPLMAVNGLLARIGFAIENRGHVVPHDQITDGTENATLLIPSNSHLRLRVEHHNRLDRQIVVDNRGKALVICRRDNGKRSVQSSQRIYLSYSDARRGRYRAVWKAGERNWWIETVPVSGSPDLFQIFEMQMVWLERLAPVLAAHVPSLPDSLTWELRSPPAPGLKAEEFTLPGADSLKSAIHSSLDAENNTVVTEIGLPFFLGLSHSSNISEVTLLEGFVEELANLAPGARPDVAQILAEAVPSTEARQLHAFAPRNFRDHLQHSAIEKTVEISRFDDASQRLGLGWSGVPRPGGIVRGRDECTKALNAITAAAEEQFCQYLKQFERRDVIARVVANHETSVIEKDRWERTSGAIISLHENPENARREIHDKIGKANSTSQASRVILEAAICECPLGRGFKIADFDLSNLMAMAMMIHHLGGYSDAIRYEGMRPELRVSPAGEVQIDVSFFDEIISPVGESYLNGQIDRARENYASLVRDPEIVTQEEAHERLDPRFAIAWTAEFAVSIGEFRKAVDVLENRLLLAGRLWEIIPRSKLLGHLSDHVSSAEAFITSLEMLPRNGWKEVVPPFTDQDRQPWRFRRRLSVARRPILRLDTKNDPEVLVAPGLIRDAFRVVFHNFYHGQYDLRTIRSKEMRDWREHIVANEAAEFEGRVVNCFQSIGWNARRGAKFSHILGKKMLEDPGDVDVLAWHPDGRILLLECKDLQFAKTSSEIAKQLYKFRGKTDEKGRPDLLGKHLKRLELAKQNVPSFERHLKISNANIDGALVFAHTVPMSFAAERMGHSTKVFTFDELKAAFGGI